jgi:uncharacterized membrane protein
MNELAVRELLDILLRWVHLIAGIMWIGNSMLWNWLDRNLVKDEGAGELHLGRIWLLHSGAFYEMEKKLLGPGQMPKVLHWFKWQSYTTWLTGFALLVLLYWSGDAALMIDPGVMRLSGSQAAPIGVVVVLGGFLLYDLTWRALHRSPRVAMAITLLLLAGLVVGLPRVLSGRAAFIHIGAMLGTCMSGNVLFHIMPAQRKLVAATQAGRPQDPADSIHAKQRSIHNNYLTFPLLFTMLSNHFASITGSPVSGLLLGVFFVGGALARHVLNIRFTFGPWRPALAATIVGTFALAGLLVVRNQPAPVAVDASGPPVTFAQVEFVLQSRCVPCHSDAPTLASNPPAPAGVRFDTPEALALWNERIKARVVVTRTMPLNNRTGMTEEERGIVARWVMQGGRDR